MVHPLHQNYCLLSRVIIQNDFFFDFVQEPLPSNNLNICVRLPDGSYSGDSLDSPNGELDEKLYMHQRSTDSLP